MGEITTSDIVRNIKAGSTNSKVNSTPLLNSLASKPSNPNLQTLHLSEKKTPMTALYDRLNDGTYVAKYENYLGATGNEDRLAKQQSTSSKWGNGLLKAGLKTINYAYDSVVGTAYGLAKGAISGDFNDIYDNDLTRSLDDANKKLDNNLHNYYSDDEKSKNIFQSMGTANFWANDVAGGLAFVGGAILPELAIGALSGGTSLGVSAAKLGLKTFGKSLAKEGLKSTAKKVATTTLKNLNVLKTGKTLGDAVKTGAFLARSANFEAGMEARQNFKDAVDNYYSTFQEKHGRTPTYNESKAFMDDARKASNGVYGANMALLTVSNAVMFGKKLMPTSVSNKLGSVTNQTNRIIGLGTKTEVVDGVLKTTMRGANRTQKILGNAYMIGKKPLTEGLWEEGLQGVAGKTMQNYLDAKYNHKNIEGFSAWSAMHDAFAEQYSSNEGWKEMGIGMIIGLVGGGLHPTAVKSGHGFEGFGKLSRKSTYTQKEEALAKSNEGIQDLHATLANLNRVSAAKAMGTEGGVTSPFQDVVSNFNYIKSQEHVKNPSETQDDFNTTIDNLDLSKESNPDMHEALQSAGMTEDEYKQQLKDNFDTHLKNYRLGKDAVTALGLDSSIKNTPGNLAEIGEALHLQIMAGQGALEQAKQIGQHIDKIVGTNGIFDYYQHYNNLPKKSQEAADELVSKQKALKALQDTALELGNQLAGVTNRTGAKSDILVPAREKVSEKAVVTQERIISLQKEIDTISEALQGDFRTTGFDLTGKMEASTFTSNPIDTLNEIAKMDTYVESLKKMGKTKEAATMENLVGQFKAYQFAHKEMVDGHRRMLDSNFFSSKEGKGLIDKIIGPKYELSDAAREDMKKGSDAMEASLKLSGIQDKHDVAFNKAIAENDNLSDREKHRYESLIRMQLAANTIGDIAKQLDKVAINNTTEQNITKDPLEGDTIALKQALNLKEEGLDNLEALNKAIKAITDELDYVVNYNTKNQNEVNKLKAQIDKLNDQKSALEEQLKNPVQEEVVPEGTEAVQQNAPISDTEQTNPVNNLQEEIDKIDKKISEIEDKISELGKDFKILESEDFKRYEVLAKKNEKGTITPKEIDEFLSLRDDIDQWTFITGVVAEGFRLSDLVQQRAVLQETEIASTGTVVLPTSEDTLEAMEIPDTNKKANYSYGLTYDKAVVSYDGDNVVVHNMSEKQFKKLTEGLDIPITEDEQNNIVFDKKYLEDLKANSNFRIAKSKTANTYSVALEVIPADSTMSGNEEVKPVDSDYNEPHDIQAIYATNPGDKVIVSVDMYNPWNQDLIHKYESVRRVYNTKAKPNKADKKALEEAKDAIRKKLNMQASIGGKVVATFKGSRQEIKNETTDKIFEQFRNAITENPVFLGLLAQDGQKRVDVEIQKADGSFGTPTISVKNILLGHPNYNYTNDENGNIGTESRQLMTDKQLDAIVDIGYLRGGKTFTRDHQGVNTTFLSVLAEKNPKSDIPFIVLNVGGKRVAYPVTMNTKNDIDFSEFTDIYNSQEGTLVDKANALNRYLASRGVDIKQKGNAFIAFGDTNINDDFFNDKLAQMQGINYFYAIEDWIKPETDMRDIARNQITVDIDVTNPFHSPKLVFDYSELDVKAGAVTNTSVSNAKKNVAATVTATTPSSIFSC
jgi:hypothetical protein